MASAIFTETILIISSVIIAATLSGTVFTKMGTIESTFAATTKNANDIALTKIEIIYVTNSSSSKVNAWVKNIGMNPITSPESADVYFGNKGNVTRIPYNAGPVSTWNYSQPSQVWNVRDTVQFVIYYDTTLQKSKTYELKVTTSNGVSDEHIFSIP